MPPRFTFPTHPTVLRQEFHPVYDTLTIRPGWAPNRAILFMDPVGFTGKTPAETNMNMSGQLGSPIQAVWKWIKAIFEAGSSEDIEKVAQAYTVRLIRGYNNDHFKLPISAFSPILPRENLEALQDFTGESRSWLSWPWRESPIQELKVDSTMAFSVELEALSLPLIQGDVRLKIMLGPDIYRPLQ